MKQLPALAMVQSPQPATRCCLDFFSDAFFAFRVAQLPMPVTQFGDRNLAILQLLHQSSFREVVHSNDGTVR